jgi:hypothetical protein
MFSPASSVGSQMKQVKAGERVLVVGNSREPWLCAKKDEKAFLAFWNKFIFTPEPDYASRRVCPPPVGCPLMSAFRSVGSMHPVWSPSGCWQR